MTVQPPGAGPVEPPASRFTFDDLVLAENRDLVAVGADLQPGTLLAAYRAGLFPMGLGRHGRGRIGWWSPDPRGVLPLDGLRVSRSLRRSCARDDHDRRPAFDDVVAGVCGPGTARPLDHAAHRDGVHAPARPRLGALGGVLASRAPGRWPLRGGVGGLFAGESMFHLESDASKVALVRLVDLLAADGARGRLLDVQWRTEHLAGLGVVSVGRLEYLRLVSRALDLDLPEPWCGTPRTTIRDQP